MYKAAVLQLLEEICAYLQQNRYRQAFCLSFLFQQSSDSPDSTQSPPPSPQGNRFYLQATIGPIIVRLNALYVQEEAWKRHLLKKKVNIHQQMERPQLPQRRECVFFSVTGWVISLWALLPASHPCSYQTQHRCSFVATVPLCQSWLKDSLPGATLSLHWSPVFLLCLHFIQLSLSTVTKKTFLRGSCEKYHRDAVDTSHITLKFPQTATFHSLHLLSSLNWLLLCRWIQPEKSIKPLNKLQTVPGAERRTLVSKV